VTRNDVGRNDPCPCGSGKKYKYCCLRRDQQRRRRAKASPVPAPQLDVGSLLREVHPLSRELRNVPGDEARELEKQAEEIEHMARFFALRNEIEAAMEDLEAHWEGAKTFGKDPSQPMRRATELFSEDRFADLRISVDELHQAFEVVGYPVPGPYGLDDEDMDVLLDASIHLAGDEERRTYVAERLLITLPDIVAGGRYQDAWLIQQSAQRLIESPESGNAFMFVMVERAMQAWAQEIEREQQSVAEEVGIDVERLRASTASEFGALAEELGRDPSKRARIERFIDQDPLLQRQAQEFMRRQERHALRLLEREDADDLLLSLEELRPWVARLAERLPMLVSELGLLEPGAEPDPEDVGAVRDVIRELTSEMSPAIFTPERLRRLVKELRDYRRSLMDAGEEEAAHWAESALAVADREGPPGDNPLLLSVCFVSLRELLQAMSEVSISEDAEGRSTDAAEQES